MLTKNEILGINEKLQNKSLTELVDTIMKEAAKSGSSDVHFKIHDEKSFRIKFRVDGTLQTIFSTQLKSKGGDDLFGQIRTYIRMRANLKNDEIFLPQDGSFFVLDYGGKKINLRVSLMPGKFGHFDIVIRLLDAEKNLNNMKLESVNFPQNTQESIIDIFRNFSGSVSGKGGLVLVTGPVGSGKTTTLYTFIEYLMRTKPGLCIKTLEDPIEYEVAGIDQSEIKDLNGDGNGYTFAKGLKAILRQNADIIVIGEIRDAEVASLAIEAALTGHLVISTLHVNSAVDVYARLIEMGCSVSQLSYVLKLVLCQRLVPKLCKECNKPMTSDNCNKFNNFKEFLSVQDDLPKDIIDKYLGKIHVKMEGQSCSTCGGVGTKGRVAIYDVLLFNEVVGELFKKYKEDKATLLQELQKLGYVDLSLDLLFKIMNGDVDANLDGIFD